jgi:hypothetical protein
MERGTQVINPGFGGPNPWLALARNVARALGMFVWRGDFIARHNLPYRPVFDPVMSVFFLAGVVIAFVRALRPRSNNTACALALIWTAVILLPTILAEDTPHFLRAVGVLPIIAIFPALALEKISNSKFQLSNIKWGRGKWSFEIEHLIFPVVFASSLAFTSYDYFVRYANDQTVRYWFDDAGVQLAAEINRFTGTGWTGTEWIVPDRAPAPDRRVFLDRTLWESPDFVNTRFLVPYTSTLALIKTGGELPTPSAGLTLLLLWPYEDWRRDLALLPRQAVIEIHNGALSKGDRDPEPIVTYLVVHAEPYTSLPEPLARFRGGLQLVGAEVQGTRVRLTWYAPQMLTTDYVVFVHALRDSVQVAQHDSDPANGLYPMSQWRPGDMVIDEHVLPGAWDAEHDKVMVGLYRRDTGERLPIVDATGNVVSDSVQVTH